MQVPVCFLPDCFPTKICIRDKLPAMLRNLVVLLFIFAPVHCAFGQWEIQPSHSSANLRGIHSVSALVAWASGSDGTILRTDDGGAHWQRCAVPTGAEKLDFRGTWAWDANTALVMSAGPGDQSRLYKTTDGGSHWTEERRNSDPKGFWDAIAFAGQTFGLSRDDPTGVLMGDPVRGHFYTEVLLSGHGWSVDGSSCVARPEEAAFAASNSSVFVFGPRRYMIATGGKGGPRILLSPLLAHRDISKGCLAVALPLASGTESSGAFAVVFRDLKHGVVVGGDYKKPDDRSNTAAWTTDAGHHWTAAARSPGGYRSGLAWDAGRKAWITAGTNGTDISYDDGKTWVSLDHGNWNGVALPFAVGPNGRIGKLHPGSPQP